MIEIEAKATLRACFLGMARLRRESGLGKGLAHRVARMMKQVSIVLLQMSRLLVKAKSCDRHWSPS